MENIKKQILKIPYMFLFVLLGCLTATAQNGTTVRGTVLDDKGETIIGASVALKDNGSIGTITDIDGNFTLSVPNANAVLVVSYIGMKSKEVKVTGQGLLKIVLEDDSQQLEEVVIVGYGQQKKESIVGAISQTSGKVLQRAGGVTSVGAALTGNIPGVTTVQSKGTPGEEDPTIYIRGQSTWNNSSPLILVDGVERPMSGLDVNSIESISVLKDASATAVFGVKGANGVILITTKRGQEGKASIQVTGNATMKIPSKLPKKYDAYDALRIRNLAIERELSLSETSWADYTPYSELGKYRNPGSLEESERYPNVDWQKELFKDYCMSYNANVSVSGGTSFVKYFASMDYTHEGDLMRVRGNDKGYKSGYGYDRVNIRSNLDFNLTKTTKFSMNLAGNYGDQQNNWTGDLEYRVWQAAYSMAPDVFLPKYSDGSWGYYPNDQITNMNSAQVLANSGVRHNKTTRLNADFILEQDLGMFLKGLSVKGMLSTDNTFVSEGGIKDSDTYISKWIDPVDGKVYTNSEAQNNRYDYIIRPWTVSPDGMINWKTQRKTFYQLQLNYTQKFGKHNVGAMGLFSRDESANGSEFPNYREDWVFRTTYDYISRYFIEFNGAYNGSEKFGKNYRFEFFPSAALGWMVSEEKFLRDLKWLDMLKIRASYGQVGDDSVDKRWLYMTQWAYGSKDNAGNAHLGPNGGDQSPYSWYRETAVGNPDVRWEKVTKKNIGVDYALLGGLISGNFDYFKDRRTDILLKGADRAVPDYFGAVPAVANLGKVEVKGYEFEVRLNHTFRNDVRLWGNFNMTHSKDKVLYHDDAELLPAYQKKEGFQIGQGKYQIITDFYNTWDELYGSTPLDTYDKEKLPGDYGFVDFNGDGVIDKYDEAPYGYPDRPQNTYNWTVGFEYKGFGAFLQFYAVNNVSRFWNFGNFAGNTNIVYDQGSYWSKDDYNAESFLPRWKTHAQYGFGRNYYLYDGSYIRLKTAEVAYTWNDGWVKKLGLGSMRLYLNGNNLFFWSKMPDDRESNSGVATQGGYPTMKRINLGFTITL